MWYHAVLRAVLYCIIHHAQARCKARRLTVVMKHLTMGWDSKPEFDSLVVFTMACISVDGHSHHRQHSLVQTKAGRHA